MRSRNLLHVSKLNKFVNWLVDNGYDIRKSRAQFGTVDVRINSKWVPIYRKLDTNAGNKLEHLTVYGEVFKLCRSFIEWERNNND